MQREYWKSP